MHKRLGLYVHIPFCRQKCLYCDFCSHPGTPEEAEAYCRALLAEIAAAPRAQGWEADTVFFGGGTPSLLGESLLPLLDGLAAAFPLSGGAEITFEANPATLNRETLRALRRGGFNRISIGAQSFVPEELAALGRIHTPADTVRAVEDARAAGFENLNLDLMFSIPHQTTESLAYSLDTACALSPEHLSVYGLTVEEHTPFGRMGKTLPLPGEEDEQKMAERLYEIPGYGHYEISNYALPGYACRHNLHYWHGEEYLGFGVAAASFYNGVRTVNTTDMATYFASPAAAVAERVKVTEPDAAYEYLMLGLRLAEGVRGTVYEARFARPFAPYAAVLEKYVPFGLVRRQVDGYALTPGGFRVSNSVLEELLETAQHQQNQM